MSRFLALLISLVPTALVAQEEGFRSLITPGLEGWKVVGKGRFRCVEGVVEADSKSKSWLVTRETFGDFDLRLELRLADGGNSGVQFRTQVLRGRVAGYQAEVDCSPRAWSGGLYDEGRRGWLHPLKGKEVARRAFLPGAWNRYRILCTGDRLRIWVNGVLTTDYRDPVDLEGVVGLQHHGEADKRYRFRRVRVRPLGTSRWGGRSLSKLAKVGGSESWSLRGGRLRGAAGSTASTSLELLPDLATHSVRLHYRLLEGDAALVTGGVRIKLEGEKKRAEELVVCASKDELGVYRGEKRTATLRRSAADASKPLRLHLGRGARIEVERFAVLEPGGPR